MFMKQALCIGVNGYSPSGLILVPCLNDASDLTRNLQAIGFDAHYAPDLSLRPMKSTIRRFIQSIQPGSIALFYFSGHGAQSNGHNYLIPTNAVGIYADNIKSTAVDAQKVINAMHKRLPALVICILDCCRDPPPTEPIRDESRYYRRPLDGTFPGFAPMRAQPASIIAYACAPGALASADSIAGRNSLYTSHLLKYIRIPNVDVGIVLEYAAAGVREESKDQQIPYLYRNVTEPIYLAGYSGYKALTLPQHMQRQRSIQPVNMHYRKGFPVRHSQPRRQHFYPHSYDRSVMPRNHPQVFGYPQKNRMAVPAEFRSPFPRQLWHHRR